MKTLPALIDPREFADIDLHFARFIGDFGGGELPMLAAAALSRDVRSGHICLDLANAPGNPGGPEGEQPWPSLEKWRAALKKSRAVRECDGDACAKEPRPLVLDEAGRLYLRRYWDYENSLAAAILSRCEGNAQPDAPSGDLHGLAIKTALARRFVVISGGPGTGKTTAVLKILEQMMQQPGGGDLRIALAAPTGKAAARLEETFRNGGANGDSLLDESLPKSASTLHRLLGWRSDSVSFRHNAKNPLPVDVVVVDEASMAPLTMMAKLFDALPARARVILLGDRHQLASVEPGNVLGDIADAASVPGSPLYGSLVTFHKNYRFGEKSNIFALSNAVREGDTQRVFEIVNAGDTPDLSFARTPSPAKLAGKLRARIVAGYSACLKATGPGEALKSFAGFRVLCALRSGPYGVEDLNKGIEQILRGEGLVRGNARHYAGLPVLVTRNDYELQLFNGDVGILFPDPESNALMAWFTDESGGLRKITPARLSRYEPAFAMTVHKSQGSEYDEVLLVLPDRENRVVTRELVYTGLTRAKARAELWFQEASLRNAVEQGMKRSSGLKEKLMGRDQAVL